MKSSYQSMLKGGYFCAVIHSLCSAKITCQKGILETHAAGPEVPAV